MLTADQTTELAEMFRLLGEPNRLRIVASCLDRRLSVVGDHGAASAKRIAGFAPPAAARLLKAGRRGKRVYYRIADGHVREMPRKMIEHIAEPDEHDDSINIETGVPS